jgi:hypothetical protein
MRCLVHLLVNETTTVVALMSVTIGPGQVVIHYLNPDDAVIASDNLSAYQFFTVDQSNHRRCAFRSQLVDRTIVFQRDAESSDFLALMTRAGVFSAVPNNAFSFAIAVPAGAPSALAAYVNRVYRHWSGTAPAGGARRAVDGIVMGAIDPALPAGPLAPLAPGDAAGGGALRFSGLAVPRSAFPPLFSRMLAVRGAPVAPYVRARRQWQLTSHAEWDHNAALRVFVRDTEQWLAHAPVAFRQQFFNVALTLFAYRFGVVRPASHPQLMFLIWVVFAAFLTADCLNGRILAQSGAELGDDEAEALVFWHAKALAERAAAAAFSMHKESLSIRALLSTMSPSTLEMLNDRSVISFEFAFREAVLVFSRGRPEDTALLLAAAALACGDLRAFYQNGIVASLVLLQERLQAGPVNQVGQLEEAYSVGLQEIDARLLLYNIERMIASTRH